jgi:phytoene dehydrogenase-like protein
MAAHWLLGRNDKILCVVVRAHRHDLLTRQPRSAGCNEVEDSTDNRRKVFHLYTDLTRLEAYMTDLAPEDSRQIRKLIRSMRRIQSFEVPPEVKTLPKFYSWKQRIGSIKHLPLLFFMLRNRYQTNYDLAAKLKNPFLREAIQLIYDGEEFPMLIITFPLAFSDLKSTGYPIGGSLRFAERIEQRYRSGGKIHYNACVRKSVKMTCDGIIRKWDEIDSDITVSAADCILQYSH